MTEKTQTQMTPTLPAAAREATIKRIERLFTLLKAKAGVAAHAEIDGVNLAREIGVYLQELSGHEQLKMPFFQSIQAQLPAELDFAKAQKCVSLANNLSAPVKTLEEARRVSQMVFQAAGFLELAAPNETRKASAEPHLTVFVNTLCTARERFQKWMESEPVEKWPSERKESVKAEIKWAVELYQKL